MRLTLAICSKMFVGWQATGLVFEVVRAVELVVDDMPGVVVAEGPAGDDINGLGIAVEDSEGPEG